MQEGGPEEIGKTPYESDTIDPGDYWLLLRKKSYSDGYTKITVKSNETARYADTLYKSCRFLVFTYGISSLNAPTLRIREEGVFNREYQGIQWKTVSHLGVDLSPIRFNIPPKGRHSFMIADEMGISVDQNVSKAGQIRKIDNIAKDTVIKEGALKINRLILDAKLALGYRLMLYPLALEPYAGADFRIFNLVHLRGPLIDSTDSWNMPNMRISFPFGARIYLYASRRTALVLGCEYNADMTFVKMLDALDYDKIRRKNITGGFPTENVSTLVLSLGATF